MVDLPRNTAAEVAAAGFLQRSTPGMLPPSVGFVGLGEHRLPVSGFRPLSQTAAHQESAAARRDPTPATVVFRDPQAAESSVRTASASSQEPPSQPGNRDNAPKGQGTSDSVPSTQQRDAIGDTSAQRNIGSPDPEVRVERQGTPAGTNDLLQTPERGAPVRREPLTDKEKGEVKRFLGARIQSVELMNTDYDTVVPISLEAFLDIVDTGYIPSVEENGYTRAFDRDSLVQSAEDPEMEIDEDIPTVPLYLRPLQHAQQLAQTHGVLAELRLPINTPRTTPALWEAIKRNGKEDVDLLATYDIESEDVDIAKSNLEGYEGILVAIENPSHAKQVRNGAIHYSQIRAIMSQGSERADMAVFLDDTSLHPTYRNYAGYTIYGTEIRLGERIVSHDTVIDEEEYYGETTEMPPRLHGTRDRLKMHRPPSGGTSNTIHEEVYGYLSEPTYQQETPTQLAIIPGFGQTHLYNTEPLITRETISAFIRLHPDRFDQHTAEQVRDALFNPYTEVSDNPSLQLPTRPAGSEDVPAWEAFSQWKRAGLHLRIFDAHTASGAVQSEQGIVASSIESDRLTHLQELDSNGQALLTELATELTAHSRSQKDNRQRAQQIADNLQRQRNGVITVVDSETTIVNDIALGPIEITLGSPILETEMDELLERGATESEISRGVATLTFGNDESGATMQAVISDEGALTLLPVSMRGENLQFSAEDLQALQTALNIAALIGYYPQLIYERFGSYANFRSYLDPDEDMRGIELAQETTRDRLYQLGLDVQVNALERQGEEHIREVTVAERFMRHFDPESITI